MELINRKKKRIIFNFSVYLIKRDEEFCLRQKKFRNDDQEKYFFLVLLGVKWMFYSERRR